MLARLFREHFTVLFAANPAYDLYLTREGFEAFECPGMNAAETLAAIEKFDFSWLNEANLEAAFKAQVQAIELLKPAAILGDAVPTLRMAADKTGVPLISIVNGYMSKYFAGHRALSVTHSAYPLVKKLPPKIGVLLTEQGEALGFRTVHKPFKALRRKWHLPEKKYYPDELEGDYTLIPDMLSLFPQKKLPVNYKVIAPLFYTGNEEESELLPDERKTIFVSMGSTGAWQSMVVLNDPVFARYRIITAGDTQGFLNAPHILSVPFGDAAILFPQTDLVICHGGNGTIYQALAFGLPVLCHPAHFEQEWNVAAIEREGLGKNIAGINEPAMLLAVIEKWLAAKNSPLLREYQDRIAFYKAVLPEAIADVCTAVLKSAITL